MKDTKLTREDIYVMGWNDGFDKGRASALKEVFVKFDEFACIKNDKWYLDYKEAKLQEKELGGTK